jgi:hypothetical protein
MLHAQEGELRPPDAKATLTTALYILSVGPYIKYTGRRDNVHARA